MTAKTIAWFIALGLMLAGLQWAFEVAPKIRQSIYKMQLHSALTDCKASEGKDGDSVAYCEAIQRVINRAN